MLMVKAQRGKEEVRGKVIVVLGAEHGEKQVACEPRSGLRRERGNWQRRKQGSRAEHEGKVWVWRTR